MVGRLYPGNAVVLIQEKEAKAMADQIRAVQMLRQCINLFRINVVFAKIILGVLLIFQAGYGQKDGCFSELFGSFVEFRSTGMVVIDITESDYLTGVKFLSEIYAKDYAKGTGDEYIFLECKKSQYQTICMYEFPEMSGHGSYGISLEVTVDNTYLGQLFFYDISKKEIEEKYIYKSVDIIKCIEKNHLILMKN